MKVMKFGGTSVGSPESVRRLVRIVADSGERIVVVSAFSKVTDTLVESARRAASGKQDYRELVTALRARHDEMARTLLPLQLLPEVDSFMAATFSELEGILLGISLVREISSRGMDLVMSFGERMSSFIVAKAFEAAGFPARSVDARTIIKTDDSFGAANYLPDETEQAVRAALSDPDRVMVVTGFIGSTMEGVTSTLGRGGSDLTAGILGASLGAEEIQIWTDVDGILTADPRLVPDAFLIDQISYEEALELSHFGAKVLHPPTVRPAMSEDIPIRIRNSFKPHGPGTLISSSASMSEYPVRGIASIHSIDFIRVQGTGMIGVAGIGGRLFGCLSAAGVNVILITQASSEHSICCAISPVDTVRAVAALGKEFSLEIVAGLIDKPYVEKDLCIVAVVGDRMKRRTGISGRFFHALGRNGVNIVAIAQGSSELNISAVISARDEAKALNAVHSAFFLSGIRYAKLFLVGTGLIGGTLLAQLASQRATLLARHNIRIDLVGLANKRLMKIDPAGIDPGDWKTELSGGEPSDIRRFVDRMKHLNLPDTVFCDCTASETLPDLYLEILSSAVAIVTPNKRGNAGPIQRYHSLTGYSRETGIPYRYETTVGAGLPIIGPLQDLVASGDHIKRIEAVLSGTISYILNSFGKGGKFSEFVREAKALGYTEPDPRDDLSAADAARKTLILAREMGVNLDFANIRIEPILPPECFKAPTVEAFFEALGQFDEEFDRRRADAASRNAVLRYVAVIDEHGDASLGFREAGPDDPFRALTGTDNMVVFTTSRYDVLPMVVKGPGAGAEVTAGGVFADIVKLARTPG